MFNKSGQWYGSKPGSSDVRVDRSAKTIARGLLITYIPLLLVQVIELNLGQRTLTIGRGTYHCTADK